MTRRKQALESLVKVNQALYKQSLIQLKDKIQQVESANQSLQMLIQFRSEYHMPVENVKKGRLLSRQSFIENLHLSIQEQRKALKSAKQQLVLAQNRTYEMFKSSKGMETLLQQEHLKILDIELEKQEKEFEDIMQSKYLNQSKRSV